jgi:hypothetical protein
MQDLADSGLLSIQIPEASLADHFKDVIQKFQRWGSQHRSGDEIQAAVLHAYTDPVPLFDESSASQILADFRRSLEPSDTRAIVDPVFDARVFLALAQEFDRQWWEINRDLGDYQDKVRHLYADINVEETNPVKEPLSTLEIRPGDPIGYLPIKRLEAWAGLYGRDKGDSGILLTSSPAVVEHFAAHIPVLEKIHQFGSVPVAGGRGEDSGKWRENLLVYLIRLTQAQWPAAPNLPPDVFNPNKQDVRFCLTIHLIPDVAPRDCFVRCLSASLPNSGRKTVSSTIRNTVIGLIQPHESVG